MRNQCTECDEFEGKCKCKRPSFQQVSESKDWKSVKSKETKTPDVTEIIKGKIGNLFVESIMYDNQPCFLVNDNGRIRKSIRETIDGVIYTPITQERGYPSYSFDKLYLDLLINNPPTKESILDQLGKLVDFYLVADQTTKSLVLGDLLLTYSMEWIDTVHFPYVVGETESGKSTILHLFRRIGYRPQYGEDIPAADITISWEKERKLLELFLKMKLKKWQELIEKKLECTRTATLVEPQRLESSGPIPTTRDKNSTKHFVSKYLQEKEFQKIRVSKKDAQKYSCLRAHLKEISREFPKKLRILFAYCEINYYFGKLQTITKG